MPYSEAFKAKVVRKMIGPPPQSANSLAQDMGVCQTTLSRWLREAGRVEDMTKSNKKPKRPLDWSPEEKFEVVMEAAALPDEQLGGFLRRQGLHQTQLAEWRRLAIAGMKQQRRDRTRGKSPEARRIRELERELRRKEAALAETAALLVLKKKARAIWGDEDDDTLSRSGK